MERIKGYIEVTDQELGTKVLCSVKRIAAVLDCGDNHAFLETGVDKNLESIGMVVEESYVVVKRRLAEAIGV